MTEENTAYASRKTEYSIQSSQQNPYKVKHVIKHVLVKFVELRIVQVKLRKNLLQKLSTKSFEIFLIYISMNVWFLSGLQSVINTRMINKLSKNTLKICVF